MDKTKKEQAEKLQIRLDKLLQTREKKQASFEKAKKELSDLSKNIDGVKLKLFEILQSGSDDTVFSNWAKRKISENGNSDNAKSENSDNAKTANHENVNSANRANADSVKQQKPVSQNQPSHTTQKPPPQTSQKT